MRKRSGFSFVLALEDSKASAGTSSAELVARAGPSGARSDGDEASAWPSLSAQPQTVTTKR